jgi:hypothetical protein
MREPLLYAKAALFVVLATLAATLLLAEERGPARALFLAVCISASCRAYDFAFYVLER